jgi:hypothetical protein
LALIFPESVLRYEMRGDQMFLAPEFVSEPALPAYPAHLLRAGLPEQVICVEVDIDTGGEVFATRELTDTAGCPTVDAQPDGAFYDVAVTAAVSWQFLAAAVCTFPANIEANDRCEGEGVTMEPVEVRLAFAFSFRSDPGGGGVSLRKL